MSRPSPHPRRISFMRFLDLELEDPALDATRIWLFCEALALVLAGISRPRATLGAAARSLTPRLCRCPSNAIQRRRTKRSRPARRRRDGSSRRQACPEGQGRALDKEERREFLRLQEPPRRGQGAQADPQMGFRRTHPCTTVRSWTLCSISPIPARGSGRTALSAHTSAALHENEPRASRAPVRVATDAVESGGIGIIVPISGNHVFPLVAHPVFVDFRC